MNLLAIDQGSKACGVAYFAGNDVTPAHTDLFRRDGIPWLERMHYIAGELTKVAAARFWNPDVVAIEDVAVWMNTRTALQMAEARGYLKRVVHELFPRARYVDVNPSTTKAAAGASGARVRAKLQIMRAVEMATGMRELSEDQADAIAIGWAAFGILQRARLEELGRDRA
ncbi:MAG TPA: crossover junction endodeoxyribonuclease RuvC [Candidatus Limnocylindria bacterium]|nr:crossover junction endodeoxyribonuclease RuvC [Candidatus Limnocylindria bacterium]